MGGATVNPGQYRSRPDSQTPGQILAAKQAIGQVGLETASADLAAAQAGALQTDRAMLDLYTKMQPLQTTFDAEQTSRQAAELGLSNLSRSRQFEQMTSPATARMRLQLPEQIESATSGEAFGNYMDAWLKQKGISAVGGTGVDPSSTFGRSMLADASTDEGRKRILEDIALRQGFVQSQEAPAGGIDPGTLMAARQASEAGNLGAMSDWQRGILAGAGQLGQTLNQFQQARMGLNQSAFDYLSRNMGEILNLQQTNQANRQAYEQSLYDAASQSAASKNAMTGQLIGAGAGLAGAGIGAAAIII
jgi:hypothetical protein